MQIEEFLKEKGFKITEARKAILAILKKTTKPMDVQAIMLELKKQNIKSDPATVFRTMNSFAEKGVVRQVQLMEGKVRYELLDVVDHHHFICKNCREIQDISDCNISALEKKIEEKKKVKVLSHSLEFYGLCTNCLKPNQK